MQALLHSLIAFLRSGQELHLVTPDDNNDLSWGTTRGIYCGNGGNMKVTDAVGNTLIIPSLAAGIIHSLEVKRIHNTSTTASNIMVVY